MLKKMQVAAVEAIKEPTRCTLRIMDSAKTLSMPLSSIIPPKTMAQTISQMVLSIPAIPRVTRSSFTSAFSVTMLISPNNAIMTPLNPM